MKIYPSLISSDLLNLEKVIKILEPEVEGFHIDVMDDHFVPNLTWGPSFINAIAKKTEKALDVHLMVDDPSKWLDRLNLRSFDFFTFHYEAVDLSFIKTFIGKIKGKNFKVGMAINPKTKIEDIIDFLDELDYLLVMSVEPGFSGQKYMAEVENKIKRLIDYRKEHNSKFKVGIDGGVGSDNIDRLRKLGVDLCGVASSIFSKDDWVKALRELKK